MFLCIAVNLETLFAILVVDGITFEISNASLPITANNFIEGGGKLIIGQEQDSFGGKFDPFESLKGSVGDLKIYSDDLDTSVLEDFTTGEYIDDNRLIVSFDKFETFINKNIQTYQLNNTDSLKKIITPITSLFSHLNNFEDAEKMCNNLAGNLLYPMSDDENTKLFEIVSNEDEFCVSTMFTLDIMWLGKPLKNFEKNESNRSYSLPFQNFLRMSDAIDISDKDCPTFYGCKTKSEIWQKRWGKIGCDQIRKFACKFENRPLIRVRGLKRLKLDHNYVLNDSLVDPNLIGIYSSVIEYIADNDEFPYGYWKMHDLLYTDKIFLNITKQSWSPIGLKTWWKKNEQDKQEIFTLMVTVCLRDQFPCNDGSCLNMTERCDNVAQCPDASDEKECQILRVVATESENNAVMKLPSKSFFDIFIKTEILQVKNLDINTFNLQTDVKVTIEWYDLTVTFYNLKNDYIRNELFSNYLSHTWTPSFVLFGHNNSITDIQTLKMHYFVQRRSAPEPDEDANYNTGEACAQIENGIISINI